jgi:hypothetical protein
MPHSRIPQLFKLSSSLVSDRLRFNFPSSVFLHLFTYLFIYLLFQYTIKSVLNFKRLIDLQRSRCLLQYYVLLIKKILISFFFARQINLAEKNKASALVSIVS